MSSELDKTMVLCADPINPRPKNPHILKGRIGHMIRYREPEAEEREGLRLDLGTTKISSSSTTIERAKNAIQMNISNACLQWGVTRNGKRTDKWAADHLRIPTPEDEEAVREAHYTYVNAHQDLMEAKARAYARGKRVTLKIARELFDTWAEIEKREVP